MVCEVKFGAKILPAYTPLDIKVKQQFQSGKNASLYVILKNSSTIVISLN